jgi:hypothetical protein
MSRFDKLARSCRWTEEDKLIAFSDALRNEAADFYSILQEREQHDYEVLKEKISERFGIKDPPSTVRRNLSSTCQFEDEDLETYSS